MDVGAAGRISTEGGAAGGAIETADEGGCCVEVSRDAGDASG